MEGYVRRSYDVFLQACSESDSEVLERTADTNALMATEGAAKKRNVAAKSSPARSGVRHGMSSQSSLGGKTFVGLIVTTFSPPQSHRPWVWRGDSQKQLDADALFFAAHADDDSTPTPQSPGKP